MLTRRELIGASLAALAVPKAALAQQKLNVVATTGMIADTVSRIGGDAVDVRGLMGPGIDPHSYRQTRSDIVTMTRADIVLWNGLFLEAQMKDVLERLAKRQPVVAVSDRLEAAARAGGATPLIAHAEYHDAFDPHIWMDPAIWGGIAARTAEALTELRPDDAATFDANLAAFQADLDALTAYGLDAMDKVPEHRRVLVTAHDAFSYFGRAFGLEVHGVQGISTNSEAGLHRIRELVEMLAEREIKAVFVESSVSDRNIRALIEGVAAKGGTLSLGGQLYSDAMGTAGTYEGTYVGMLDHNITTIARALGADVPAAGLNGELIQS
ncbi:manganese transporter [Aliishimia ponticola]|uniref:Manganese transporter n=1 Tax=Aliishimia ponticola TaxID=2499833 RepID=A0A4S4NBP6_9RHOB|nr:zinc ABC transporter substrate-binding protein [Aliishimia ponticola]THH36759.1 manganese transporter [Aliishimia ponticola]